MDVLKAKKAILDIGKKQLIFPGPGEIEMKLPEGSVITPLAEAPSGHLCMLIDAFDELSTAKGGLINHEENALRQRTPGQRAARGVAGTVGSAAAAQQPSSL